MDVGAGTGKLACAQSRLQEALPAAGVQAIAAGLGMGAALPVGWASVVTVGSVLMPILELQGGTLADGLAAA